MWSNIEYNPTAALKYRTWDLKGIIYADADAKMKRDPWFNELRGTEPNSKIIGRAQGIDALASQQEIGLLMVLNYVFIEEKYNGSTLSVLGRNPILHQVREMPIVGGSGLFRFARGYALAHTVWTNTLGDAIVQYNVTVMHY
ncbi:hypothetical protein GIB67_011657 [Kingdonia uniflora]|uniref:Dirigent protein n=1 Tax=Kingdonia uniflora TaxID=39325 RepID=A0A7J7N9Z2_9MAGN|nr:hypothetical protein GIB67_011657 [Kingdonia uniflora]